MYAIRSYYDRCNCWHSTMPLPTTAGWCVRVLCVRYATTEKWNAPLLPKRLTTPFARVPPCAWYEVCSKVWCITSYSIHYTKLYEGRPEIELGESFSECAVRRTRPFHHGAKNVARDQKASRTEKRFMTAANGSDKPPQGINRRLV